VASLSQGRTAAAQCGLFTHKSVPVIFEPRCKSDKVLAYFGSFNILCFLPLFFLFLSPVCCLFSSPLLLSVLRTCKEALVLTYTPLQMHPLQSSLQLSPPIQLSFQLSRFPICCGETHKQCKPRTVYFYLTLSKQFAETNQIITSNKQSISFHGRFTTKWVLQSRLVMKL